jgi:diadenosine tetraphosphate (Ap4A) HIT family hydrolase
LIIPKEHVRDIINLQEAHWREVSILFNWVCKEKGIRDGSVFFRFGSSPHPTSSVEHLHIHLIVGNAKDIHSIDEVEPIKVKLAYKKR